MLPCPDVVGERHPRDTHVEPMAIKALRLGATITFANPSTAPSSRRRSIARLTPDARAAESGATVALGDGELGHVPKNP